MEQLKVRESGGWRSKLITAEDEELAAKLSEQVPGRPTVEELVMIRGITLYPHLITMLQKSMGDMERAHVSLKGVLVRCLEHIMFAVSNDSLSLKRELKQRGIKVQEDNVIDDVFYYRYQCRGYDDRFGVVREAIRTEVQKLLTAYTADLGRQLRK